jgi:ribose/xylose/arabinose/galactoside ABC-type transport system permease subunit
MGMPLILLAIVGALSVLSDRFLTVSNAMTIARQISLNGIIAVGMTMVILSGGIDLSVGGVVALSGAVVANILGSTGSIPLAVACGLGVGLAVGSASGFFIAYAKLPPFIVTLAAMAVTRGTTLVYTDGRPIPVRSDPFSVIGSGFIAGIPVPVIVMLAVYIAGHVVLTRTRFGRFVYGIGGNEQACRLSGINTAAVKVGVYAVSGTLAGLAAVILTSRLYSAQPTAGQSYEMDAIAAVILGGTSLSGGEGGVLGTIAGALIIGILANGLNLLNVNPFYQDVAKGLVILAAVLLDRFIHSPDAGRSAMARGGAAGAGVSRSSGHGQ